MSLTRSNGQRNCSGSYSKREGKDTSILVSTEVDSQTVLARADCKDEWRIRRAAPKKSAAAVGLDFLPPATNSFRPSAGLAFVEGVASNFGTPGVLGEGGGSPPEGGDRKLRGVFCTKPHSKRALRASG